MTELRRQLGLFQTTLYGVGLILGAGIYVLIGQATGIAGGAVWMPFVLGAILAAFTGLSYAELVSMYPRAAAGYVYVKNAFRNEFLAFIVGWLTVFTAIVSASAVALGFAGYFAEFFGFPIVMAAVLLILALSCVNFYGIRESSWMNVVFTMIEVSGLAFIIYLGLTFTGTSEVNYFDSPLGMNGIFLATGLLFFAYTGFENIANVAEEANKPTKVVPRAILLSILITAIVYILVALSVVRVLDWQTLGTSTAPLADIARHAAGTAGQFGLSVIALFATTNTVLISLIAASRIIYGMARHGSLPPLLASIHVRTGTPWIAILAVMVVAAILVFAGNIETVANITVLALIIVFAFVNLSLILLRFKEPNLERPFKVPLALGKVPIIPLLGFITSVALMTQFDAYVLYFGMGVVGAAALFYLVYRRRVTLG